MELRGKYTLLAEGARGQLAKVLIARYGLDRDREPPKFGLGLKEVWQVAPEQHKSGLVQHTFGWPLDNRTGGGSFLYHYGENLVSVGFVVHLNYQNPYWRRSKNSNGSRRIRWCVTRLRAANGSRMARAPLPRAVGSPCPNSRSREAH